MNDWDEELEDLPECVLEDMSQEAELKGQYKSSFDEKLDLTLTVEKKELTEEQIENGFVIWIEWAKPSKRILKTFKDTIEKEKIEVLDAEEYLESLNKLGTVTHIPAYVKGDKVVNGYFDVRDYLKGL